MKRKQSILSNCLAQGSDEVEQGLGRNIITPPEKESLWRQYFEKFKDPIIIVLLVVFALSVGISLYEIIWMGKGASMLLEPVGVLVALLLATGIAFVFEVKANKEFEILNKVKDDRPIVVYRSVQLSKEDEQAVPLDDLPTESVKVDVIPDKERDILNEGLDVADVESNPAPVSDAIADKVDFDYQRDSLEGDNLFCEKSVEADVVDKKSDENQQVAVEVKPVENTEPERESQTEEHKSAVVLIARPFRVKKQDVVVGDVVYLESGDEVPADGYLILSNSLKVDESKFTGELYANKGVGEEYNNPNATYPTDFLLRGAMIIEGNCYYKVTAVGDETEEGKGVALTREGSDVQTPLNMQLDQLGGWISKASFIIAALIVIGRTMLFFLSENTTVDGSFDWLHFAEFMLSSIMIAVTLIVVAVPEGLPMSVTVSLALSMRKMLKANNLVRKLHACETMGATTVICTDKTGTLTKNQMVVMATDFYGVNNEKIIELNIAVNSTAELAVEADDEVRVIGNPTEGALLKWLRESGKDYENYRRNVTIVSQQPFSTEKKYMETTVQMADGREFRLVKGAPEIVLSMCNSIAGSKSEKHIHKTLAQYQNKAMRTLGFAYQEVLKDRQTSLVFVGVVGIADPVREDVIEAIDTCRNHAGVRVIIVTGDTPGTANEIGRQIGLLAPNEPPQTVTGPEFAAMSDEQALELIEKDSFKIISRARPDDKARLVTLLQQLNHVVAVTGDGTNDAPALSKAQVGLSMGDGTARAKEASDITIIDNSFSSINKAIMWGRSLYLNIRRFIIFQMTINLCACLIVLLGAFLGLESPLTVTQMLWVNLIMDTFAAMALSSLPPDKSVLNERPRDPKSHIINKSMLKRICGAGLFFFVFLAAFWQLLGHIDVDTVAELFKPESLRSFFMDVLQPTKSHMSGHDKGVFFTMFVLLQFWNIFNAKYYNTNRSLMGDFIDLFRNRKAVVESNSAGFWIIAAVILVGQVLIVNFAGSFFNVTALSLQDWLLLLLFTSPVLIIPDIVRTIKR